MHTIHGILFDFDGTLAELHIDFDDMRRQVAELATLFLDRDIDLRSAPVLEWIDELAQIMGRELDREDVLEFRSRCRMRLIGLEMRAARKGRLFPFTRGVLTALRERGVRTGVVTRNCTAAVREMYPDIENAVDCVLARDDVSRVKPDPEHLLRAAELLGLTPVQCVMAGDHWLDVVAAKKAGMRSAAVCTGRVSRKELTGYGPDFTAADVQSLVQEFQRLGLLVGDG